MSNPREKHSSVFKLNFFQSLRHFVNHWWCNHSHLIFLSPFSYSKNFIAFVQLLTWALASIYKLSPIYALDLVKDIWDNFCYKVFLRKFYILRCFSLKGVSHSIYNKKNLLACFLLRENPNDFSSNRSVLKFTNNWINPFLNSNLVDGNSFLLF